MTPELLVAVEAAEAASRTRDRVAAAEVCRTVPSRFDILVVSADDSNTLWLPEQVRAGDGEVLTVSDTDDHRVDWYRQLQEALMCISTTEGEIEAAFDNLISYEANGELLVIDLRCKRLVLAGHPREWVESYGRSQSVDAGAGV